MMLDGVRLCSKAVHSSAACGPGTPSGIRTRDPAPQCGPAQPNPIQLAVGADERPARTRPGADRRRRAEKGRRERERERERESLPEALGGGGERSAGGGPIIMKMIVVFRTFLLSPGVPKSGFRDI